MGVMIILGFILGFSMISKYVLAKKPETKEKAKQILNKLIKYQISLGYAGILVSLLLIIWRNVFLGF